MLFYGNRALVAGEGQETRARVITDGLEINPPAHIKAMKVRLYLLYGSNDRGFRAFIIKCNSKVEARRIEKEVHVTIGGNNSEIGPEILNQLFDPLEDGSLASIFLRQALCSSYDGISDLKKWRREGIIADDVWQVICESLKLNYMMPEL
jgi:hypothetical protein